MSNHTKELSHVEQREARVPLAQLPATQYFAETFNDRLGSAYGDSTLEDMKLSVGQDLPAALERGSLQEAQGILEGGWWNNDRRTRKLSSERRDALVELHIADKGTPTAEQLAVARQEAQKAILRAETHGDKEERSRVFNNLFTRHESSSELEEGIEWLEDLIRDESVLSPAGEKIEHLRIARDRLHQDYRREKEWEDNKERFGGELRAIVGEHNGIFPPEKIEEVSSWLSGEAADNMAFVMGEINGSSAQERAILLTDLAHGKIPVHTEEFDAWRQERGARRAEKAQKAQENAVDSARSAVDKSF